MSVPKMRTASPKRVAMVTSASRISGDGPGHLRRRRAPSDSRPRRPLARSSAGCAHSEPDAAWGVTPARAGSASAVLNQAAVRASPSSSPTAAR